MGSSIRPNHHDVGASSPSSRLTSHPLLSASALSSNFAKPENELYQLQYNSNNNGSVSTMGIAGNNQHGTGHGDDQNNNLISGPAKDHACGNDSDAVITASNINALDWQTFTDATNYSQYNNFHNNYSKPPPSSRTHNNGNVDSYEGTHKGETSNGPSGTLFQGQHTTALHNPSNKSSVPASDADPSHSVPISSGTMLTMNINNPLFHSGVTTAHPTSLASYMNTNNMSNMNMGNMDMNMGNMNMNMGNMNMNMNMNLGMNAMGYAGLQGLAGSGIMNPFTFDTTSPNMILPSHLHPQTFMVGTGGGTEGMVSMTEKMMQNNESRGMNTFIGINNGGTGSINNISALGMSGLNSVSMGSQQSQSLLSPHHTRSKKIKVKRRKPKDHPTRPLSAYNLFFKDERRRLMKGDDNGKNDTDGISTPSKKRKPHGKIGFESVS